MKRSKGPGSQAAKAARSAVAGVGPGRQGQHVGANCLVPNSVVLAACRAIRLVDFSPEVAAFIARTVEHQLREVIEDGIKVRHQSKREQLRVDDLNFVIKLRGGTQLYGYGGGMERKETTGEKGNNVVVMLGERREDLAKAMQVDLPKVPREPSLFLHWLAIDGVQPAIPYNPPQHPRNSHGHIQVNKGDITEAEVLSLPESTHPLSQEMELYFGRVIKALFTGSEEEQRPVLQSLVSDTGLHELMPYFSFYIHVTINRILGRTGSLTPFWAVLRLFRCLVLNKNLHLELYFHQMAVGVATIIVNNKLTQDSHTDTTAVRVYAAQALGVGVRTLSRKYPNLVWKICNTFVDKLDELQPMAKIPLPTLYGCIVGTRYLGGHGPVETALIPMADMWLTKLEKIMGDTKAKPRRRREAQLCHAELTDVVGEYIEHKQQLTKSLASSLESFGSKPDNKESRGSGHHSEGMLPYVAQSGYREAMTWL